MLRQFGQYAARQGHRIALGQRGGHSAHRQRSGREGADFQAQRMQGVGMCFGGGSFFGGGGKGGGDQQGLAGHTWARPGGSLRVRQFAPLALWVRRVGSASAWVVWHCAGVLRGVARLPLRFETFIHDALVRGVHVDHDQALRVFGQDINPLQLRQRAAQRPVLGVGMRRFPRLVGRARIRRMRCALRWPCVRVYALRFKGAGIARSTRCAHPQSAHITHPMPHAFMVRKRHALLAHKQG